MAVATLARATGQVAEAVRRNVVAHLRGVATNLLGVLPPDRILKAVAAAVEEVVEASVESAVDGVVVDVVSEEGLERLRAPLPHPPRAAEAILRRMYPPPITTARFRRQSGRRSLWPCRRSEG